MNLRLFYPFYLVTSLIGFILEIDHLVTIYLIGFSISVILRNRIIHFSTLSLFFTLILIVGPLSNGEILKVIGIVFSILAITEISRSDRNMSNFLKGFKFLWIIPLIESVLNSEGIYYGSLRDQGVVDYVFLSNTMELPFVAYVGLSNYNNKNRFLVHLFLLILFILTSRRFLLLTNIFLLSRYFISNLLYMRFLLAFTFFFPFIFLLAGKLISTIRYSLLIDWISRGKGVENIISASGRIKAWINSFLEFIQLNPDNFFGLQKIPKEWFFTNKERYHHMHNSFLQLWVEGGYIPIFALTIFIFLISKRLVESTSYMRIYLVTLPLVCFATESLFTNVNLILLITALNLGYAYNTNTEA